MINSLLLLLVGLLRYDTLKKDSWNLFANAKLILKWTREKRVIHKPTRVFEHAPMKRRTRDTVELLALILLLLIPSIHTLGQEKDKKSLP